MSALVISTTMQRHIRHLRSSGYELEFGKPGYPKEVWCTTSNDDHRYNYWTCFKFSPDERSFVGGEQQTWWGRWVRSP